MTLVRWPFWFTWHVLMSNGRTLCGLGEIVFPAKRTGLELEQVQGTWFLCRDCRRTIECELDHAH